MNKRRLFLPILFFFNTLIYPQVKSTDRQAIIYLSSTDNLTPIQKELVNTLKEYLENTRQAKDYFTQETLKRIRKQRKQRGSYFLLETPPALKKETIGHINLRFFIKERQKNTNQGYFTFTYRKKSWELTDIEDNLAPT